MNAQLIRLETKATELETMTSYVRAKIDWLTGSQRVPEPDFGSALNAARAYPGANSHPASD
jgi:hypothetical protein